MKIPYIIRQIETKQFAIFPDAFTNGETVKVSSEYGFGVIDDIKAILCNAIFRYEQKSKLLLVLEMACVFEIAPEGVEAIKKNDNVIPKGFLQYMASISVGTARGIIHAKTEGSVLNSVVLPPINLTEIIKDDMPISSSSEK